MQVSPHPPAGKDNYIDISSLPYQIPLGAVIPLRVQNLLTACKNLGVAHITNGCYHLHPTEWNIGEPAGARRRARQVALADSSLGLHEE